MSIEKITSKIVGDAEKEAETVLMQSKSQCDAILAEAQAKAEEIIAKAEEEGEKEKEKLIFRKKAVADIDGRKLLLVEKQKLIAGCFDKAEAELCSMEREQYIEFLVHLLKSTGQDSGELILNAGDAQSIGPALVSAAAGQIPESRIVLSGETRDIKGGFLLKQGSVYINGTIETLIEEAREELAAEAAACLFQ